jgi:hypothetical protein
MMSEGTRPSSSLLPWVAAARVGVGVVMLLAPNRFFSPGSGTETLLMQTIGIRDVVLGSGGCVAWARGADGELRRWATVGLISDTADFCLGLRSKRLVGTNGALIATLSPVPFIIGGLVGFTRSTRKP